MQKTSIGLFLAIHFSLGAALAMAIDEDKNAFYFSNYQSEFQSESHQDNGDFPVTHENGYILGANLYKDSTQSQPKGELTQFLYADGNGIIQHEEL